MVYICDHCFRWVMASSHYLNQCWLVIELMLTRHWWESLAFTWETFNSLAILMWFWKCNFQSCFTDWYLQILWWCPQMNATDDKSTLVQVMAWCRQAPSHYLNQCWPRSPMPYGVTRPQWVNWKYSSCLQLKFAVCEIHILNYDQIS